MDKIIKIFYENPEKEFTVRELAKIAKIPRSTAHKYLVKLKKEKLVSQDNKAMGSLLFKIKKTNFFTEKIIESGLIDALITHFNPACIILFGSIRKGESTKESDIDLFIESNIRKEFDFSKYETKLGYKIQPFLEGDIKKLPEHLFNNIINGIKLYGSIKIK